MYRQNLYSYEESYTDTGDHDANCEQITVKISDGVSERTARVYHDLWDLVHKEEVVETGADGVETVHKTTYEYDRYGILQSKKTPNDNAAGTSGASESYAYDYAGRVVSLTNAAGAEAETVYDSLGRVTEEYDFNGNVTGYGYNTYGLLSSVESGEAELLGQGVLPRTLYSYDENGNRALERSNFVNQNDGNTASVMQPRVHTKYDMRGRVDYVAVYEADCETKTYTKYFYDVKGNVKKVVSGLTSPSITETAIPAGASVVEYEYHPYLGVMTKMVQPDGTEQYFEYDYFGLLSEQGYVGENSETYGEISYSYSNIGELVSKTAGEEQNTYTYNLAGQVTSVTDATGTREYTYDPQGRLVQVAETSASNTTTTSYTYDLRGNRLTKAAGTDTTSYTYDLNNRLLSEAEGDTTTLYEYDDRGNLVSKRKETLTDETVTTDSASVLTDNLSENVELYTYNGFNQLSEYRTGGTRASYTYNAEGIRTSKTVNGNTTQFLLNGANVIGEIGANNQVTHYIRGATGIIYSVDGSYAQSTKKYYTTNGHGDVVGLLNNAGVLTKSYTYDAFGVEQNIDPADTNPFRYCGEYFDNESKDLYLRARYYSASTGRFTQQDPAMADGMNWYNYCGGNPVKFIDSTGLLMSEWLQEVATDQTSADAIIGAYIEGTLSDYYTASEIKALLDNALQYYISNGIFSWDDMPSYGTYNGYNYDQFDFYILAFSNYWTEKLQLYGDSAIMPGLVKAMMMAESDGGITDPSDLMQVFNIGDSSYTLARVGSGATGDWRIPEQGYGAVKKAFTNGQPDKSKVTPIMSICFGIRWFGHKIQNADGDRAQGVTKYNGGGFDATHGTSNGYLDYVRRIMASPSDYVAGKISKT